MGYTLGFRLESTIQTVGMQGRRDGAGDEVDEEEEWQTLAYVHIEQVILRLHSPSHSSGSPAASALPFAWVRTCTRVFVPLVFLHDDDDCGVALDAWLAGNAARSGMPDYIQTKTVDGVIPRARRDSARREMGRRPSRSLKMSAGIRMRR